MASDAGLYNGYHVESEAIMLCPPERETNQNKMEVVEGTNKEGQQSAVGASRIGPTPMQYMPQSLLGKQNTVTTCPFCHALVNTAVKHTVTTRTHMTAVLCSFICGCCCLPYCMNSAKNTDHYCPACQRYLGTYEK